MVMRSNGLTAVNKMIAQAGRVAYEGKYFCVLESRECLLLLVFLSLWLAFREGCQGCWKKKKTTHVCKLKTENGAPLDYHCC